MKTVPAPLLLATAVLGVAVGLGTGYLTRCPEANYPQCYHETLAQGFNVIEGLKYTVDQHWQADGSLQLVIGSNVLCPAATQVFVGQFPVGVPPEEARAKGQLKIIMTQLVEIVTETTKVTIPAARLEKNRQTFISLIPQGTTAKMFKTDDVQNNYLR